MLNNIQIKLNLHVSHSQTGYTSSHFSQIWYTGRCGSKHMNISTLEVPHQYRNGKSSGWKAISLFPFFFCQSFLFITIVTDLFPAPVSAYHQFNFFCKIISTPNLVVTLSDILASCCFSPLFSYLGRHDHTFASVRNRSFNSLQWQHKTFYA